MMVGGIVYSLTYGPSEVRRIGTTTVTVVDDLTRKLVTVPLADIYDWGTE